MYFTKDESRGTGCLSMQITYCLIQIAEHEILCKRDENIVRLRPNEEAFVLNDDYTRRKDREKFRIVFCLSNIKSNR